MIEANKRFSAGDVQGAFALYSSGLRTSRERGDARNVPRFLVGIGISHLSLHRYNDALRALDEAKRDAIRYNYPELLVTIAINRASLFRKLDDRNAAAQTLREVQAILPESPSPALLIQAGNMSADHADLDRSTAYYLAAIDRATDEQDISSLAIAWNQLGFLYMKTGQLEKADHALTNSYRVRVLHKNRRIGASYVYLAMLRLEQERPAEALKLLDHALRLRPSEMPIAPPYLRYQRARALAMLGAQQDALSEYEKAIELAQVWRLDVLPADTFRVSAEVRLHEIFAGFLETGLKLYLQDHDQKLARRLFEVSEMQRAASIRQKLQIDKRLPAHYWTMLDRFRAKWLSSTGDGGRLEDTEKLRLLLAEEEAKLGVEALWQNSHQIKEKSSPENLLSHLQSRLDDTEALLSVHASRNNTILWSITKRSFSMHFPGGLENLQAEIRVFRTALRDNKNWRESGERLAERLFGGLSSEVLSKRSWVLSVGEDLHELPFSALPSRSKGGFLIQDHSLRFTPGAFLLSQSATTRDYRKSFVAFADPVYNTADPRWPGGKADDSLQLTRLPGTAREAEWSAGEWKPASATVFTGLDFTRDKVREVLKSRPSAVHFATHVIEKPESPGAIAISTGLGSDGTHHFLTPFDIAAWKTDVGLVVLSGCSSGTGNALPGAGLVGLTRSWILAGAESVAATYWPIPDDAAQFFKTFYKGLLRADRLSVSAPAVADALRTAQLDAIRRGSSPLYWAAFFVVGNDAGQ
ncbi:MAG TPA: CHAT domain-containing tetratricopeptide repeat protein [Bryobacteraceae bacterium]|nr:CHAT domain-containing tetratricopeptide repeat protein [Bryobacteraceae bacterium]